ncbi:MAG TPA: TrkA family potassium uptake protein [Balneolales bacterium]|jgi:trk system potassium uptake protein TrkA|nr:TrkA family potassium uptake protein [Balneolales bacterium]
MSAKKDTQFAVIGLGAFGFSLAKTLAEKGGFVIAVDHNMDSIEAIKRFVPEAICFDATDPELLESHGITNVDVAVIAIGEVFEPVVLIAMELLNAGVKKVLARASSDTQETILRKIGITQVIHPEKQVGERMAVSLLHSSVRDFFELSDELAIYELEAPKAMYNYTLEDLQLRRRYNVNLITIKRPLIKNGEPLEEVDNYEILGVLHGDTKIMKGDKLVLVGNEKSINKILETH